MTTPKGCLKSIATSVMRLARYGDAEALHAYVRSDAFLATFNGLDPNRRSSAMRCYTKAEALCEAKARSPLFKPKCIDAKRAEKVKWSDPAMISKLADAYARAGGDDEKVARMLGVTLGSARLAKRRHLASAANGNREKAS